MTDESDTCPRCGGGFHCGVADAEPCACTTVRLDTDTLVALREQHVGCLCLRCLFELQRELQREVLRDAPTPP